MLSEGQSSAGRCGWKSSEEAVETKADLNSTFVVEAAVGQPYARV